MIDSSVVSNKPSNWLNWVLQGALTALMMCLGYLLDDDGSVFFIILIVALPIWLGTGLRLMTKKAVDD